MKGKKDKELREAQKELEQSISLVKAPAVLKEDPSLTLPIKVKVSKSQKQADAHLMKEWVRRLLEEFYFVIPINSRKWSSRRCTCPYLYGMVLEFWILDNMFPNL